MAIDAGEINEPVGVEETPHDRGDSVQAIHINEKLVNEESYGLRAGSVRYLRIPDTIETFDCGMASTNVNADGRSAPEVRASNGQAFGRRVEGKEAAQQVLRS
jgi:hypothetical protein